MIQIYDQKVQKNLIYVLKQDNSNLKINHYITSY